MYTVIYKTNDELDAHMVKNSLENINITAFIEHEELKSVFGDISGAATINILVDEIDLEKARDCIDEINKTNSDIQNMGARQETYKSKNFKYIVYIFMIIAIMMIYTFRYVIIGYLLSKINTSPLFTYKWNLTESCEYRYWKENGKLAGKDYDINQNYIYEKSFLYNKSGTLTYEFIDANENGINEHIIQYNALGSPVVEEFDKDDDGFIDIRFEYSGNTIIRKLYFSKGNLTEKLHDQKTGNKNP